LDDGEKYSSPISHGVLTRLPLKTTSKKRKKHNTGPLQPGVPFPINKVRKKEIYPYG